MASSIIHHGVFFLLLCLSALHFTNAATMRPRGFSLKIIPRFSIHSPLYQPNLTVSEMRKKVLQLSLHRALRLSSVMKQRMTSNNKTTSGFGPDTIRPKLLTAVDGQYVAEVIIGSPPGLSFYLLLDTGSDLNWVQCTGCVECMPLKDIPNYGAIRSDTRAVVPCDDPLCPICNEDTGVCEYYIRYLDDDHSLGTVLRDTFTFPSIVDGRVERLPDLVFGCGLNNTIKFYSDPANAEHNKIAGVLGMGPEPASFLSQYSHPRKGRFSYCLNPEKQSSSYIRFGEDADFPPNLAVQSTPLIVANPYYYVNMEGISINRVRIMIPPGTFRRKADGSGGLVVDSGCTETYLYKPHFDSYFEHYFDKFNMDVVNNTFFAMCYVPNRQFKETKNRYPTIKFLFEGGAKFLFTETNAFDYTEGVFCLRITTIEMDINILGANAQENKRILTDLDRQTFSFAMADCASSS